MKSLLCHPPSNIKKAVVEHYFEKLPLEVAPDVTLTDTLQNIIEALTEVR